MRKPVFGAIAGAGLLAGMLSLGGAACAQDLPENVKTWTSPEEALRQPDSVQALRLVRKRLDAFPKEILQFKNLRVLDLRKNRIAVLPPEIGSLRHLITLDLSRNRLTALPPEIGDLTQLHTLLLNRNRITALPPETGRLVNLETLELWDNELESVPDEIGNLKKLQKLELRGILFSDAQQERIRTLLPQATINFSPSCACKE
jgi:Leucine-rich repeat (LRR) protein